jgi:hypothetical protein
MHCSLLGLDTDLPRNVRARKGMHARTEPAWPGPPGPGTASCGASVRASVRLRLRPHPARAVRDVPH